MILTKTNFATNFLSKQGREINSGEASQSIAMDPFLYSRWWHG